MTPERGNAMADHPAGTIMPAAELTSGRLRMRAAVWLVSCVLVLSSFFLPWVVVTSVSLASGTSQEVSTPNVQDGVCALVFVPTWFPILALALAGLQMLRGRPQVVSVRRAAGLSALGIVGTLGFTLLLGFEKAMATFNPYWGRGTRTDSTIGAGFVMCVAGYLLALLASLLLRPPRAA